MYMPLEQSHKLAMLPRALIQLHHTTKKATILIEEPRTNLPVHKVWLSWRKVPGKRMAQRLYCCLAPHKYGEKSCQRTAHALCPTLCVTNIIIKQTSCTIAPKRAIEKNPPTLRKKRKKALMYFVRKKTWSVAHMHINAPIPFLHHLLISFGEVLYFCHHCHSVGFIITMVIIRNTIVISATNINL